MTSPSIPASIIGTSGEVVTNGSQAVDKHGDLVTFAAWTVDTCLGHLTNTGTDMPKSVLPTWPYKTSEW
jgi:hypothetical protein